MRISQFLRYGKSISVDASPLIYYVEEHPKYVQWLDQTFRYCLNSGIGIICSTVLLTEVLIHPLRHQDTRLVAAYRDIVTHGEPFQLLPVSTAIANTAADLRARYNLRIADALHLATAIESRCEAFLTNDKALKRVEEIRVLILDELEL